MTINTSDMHPPGDPAPIEAPFALAEQLAPEILLVANNLDTRDQTQAAVAAEARFDLFQGAVARTTPTTPSRGVRRAHRSDQPRASSLLVDAATRTAPERSPWTPYRRRWRAVGVDDRPRALRRRGMLTLTLDADPVTARLFGTRAGLAAVPSRPGARPRPGRPRYGGSSSTPSRSARRAPSRTRSSAPAWASRASPSCSPRRRCCPRPSGSGCASGLSDEEQAALEAAQKAAVEPGREPPDPVVVTGIEQVPGAWVLWRRVDSLIGQSADARVYVLDPGSGRVTFGDGRHGKIPPAGRDCIRAFAYQQGGGEAGNVAAWSEAKATSAVESVDTVVLPVDAAGGFGAAGAASDVAAAVRASLLATAPDLLRHAGQGLSPADIEALAVASATDVVRARCARPTGPRTPITVTLSVRDGDRRRPVPTLARRDAVAAFLRDVGWGALGEHGLVVTAPTYVGVAVRVDLVAAQGFIADVEDVAKTILTTLFHPVDGGPDGTGWPFGRTPTDSDVLRALRGIAGLDRVSAIALTPTGASVHVPEDGQVTAEPTDITVVVTTLEGQP